MRVRSAHHSSAGLALCERSVFLLLRWMPRPRYSSLKSGIYGMVRQMAVDFGLLGIRVNAISPGLIVKPAFEASLAADPEHKACLQNQYPGRAYGEPLDIANGVRFLCSREAKFITGHVLNIDGGLTIQLQEDMGMRQAEFKEQQLAARRPKL